MMQLISQLIFVCLLAGMINAAHAADSPARPTKLIRMRLSQSTVNTRSAILWVAQAQGFFAKYGLDVETIFLQSSNLQTAALATNEVQIGNIGGATVLSGVAGGQAFRIIASPSNQLFYDLVARPEIKDGRDMRGKRIGVTSIGGTTWMAANLGLQHYGLDAGRDGVQINAIGNQSVLVQALESGSIDLAVIDPFLSRRLKSKGMKVMIEFAKVNIPFISTAVVTTAAFLREHEDQVERFLRAFLEGQAFIAKPENKNAVLKTVATKMKISDPAAAEEGYQDMLIGIERKPYPSIEALRNIQKLMAQMNPKVASVKSEDVIDARIIRRLDESGFIDALYEAKKR
ncbi:MAG: ABC transporter substrate-binding protein [Deltaproteobacteria bacterium]|nr:ABC transporter substrate-binding protein [Deltaproteobacteria bacterium]